MTKNFSLYPKAEPTGEELANYSVLQVYKDFAIAGYGVLSGCAVTWVSATEISVALGVYTSSGVVKNFASTNKGSITAASVGYHRYDLLYIDCADDTLKLLAGTEEVPTSALDFLENYHPRPAFPTDTDWVLLAILRITENGLEQTSFGTVVYATDGIADIRKSPVFGVDDVTLQVVDGILSIKAGASHGSTHKSGGTDSIKLDEFAAPEDNTNLNASTTVHGLLKKLSNSATQFLNGQGTWAVPDHTAISNIGTNSHTTIDTFIASKASASGLASLNSSSKVVQDPANATATPTINKIPIADGSGGKLASGWIPDLSAIYATVTNHKVRHLEIGIDGGGSAIATGIKGVLRVGYACTIKKATLLADQSGSIVIDIWKCTYDQYDNSTHPVDADSITSSAPMAISSAHKSKDTTLTGWTTAIAADSVLRFNVDSCTTITNCTVDLEVEVTP